MEDQTEQNSSGLCRRSKLLARLEILQSSIERMLNYISSLILGALMLFVSAEVCGRYLFNSPIPGHYDITEMSMAFAVFLGMGYTQAVKGHIRLEYLVEKVRGRWHDITEFMNTLLCLAIYAIITYFSLKHALACKEIGDVTSSQYIPTWPSRMMVPFGSIILCCRFILQLIQYSKGIIGIK